MSPTVQALHLALFGLCPKSGAQSNSWLGLTTSLADPRDEVIINTINYYDKL